MQAQDHAPQHATREAGLNVPAAHAALDRDGYVVLERVLDEATCDFWSELVDEHWRTFLRGVAHL